ncbi:hypothetical protein OJ253_2949 [Cryptosporidium canis]|uniref:Oocyst wall protein n=1 Tax=Cryptosporidium canis TaxID=195482 RepID=A0A9D5HUW1_9CRYT|nr:hypothetical protein OJ253_2949 [Cryptosporidium canis]
MSNIQGYRNSRREPVLTRALPVTKFGDPSITLTIPARKVCHKGSFDTKYNSCTYIDKDDEAVPIYEVRMNKVPLIAETSLFNGCTSASNSTLVDGYCIGTMISDYEKYCHGYYRLNTEDLCIKYSTYIPPRRICPEGFLLKSVGQQQLQVRRCVRKLYSRPIKIPVTDSLGRERYKTECKHKDNKYCPIARPPQPAKYVMQCPKGAKLVSSLDNSKATCETKLTVIPDFDRRCGGEQSGWFWDGELSACLRLRTYEPKLRCPHPRPKLGMEIGNWDTPEYEPHPVYTCLANRARAIVKGCPSGYTLKKRKCFRLIRLPYELDCEHAEGFKFEYDSSTKKGVCKFKFNQQDYIGLPSYPSSREALTSHKIFKHANMEDIIRAYQQGTLNIRAIEEELVKEYDLLAKTGQGEQQS